MKRMHLGGIIVLIVFGASLIPFETTFVPEWKLSVVDESGNPYKEHIVGQVCHNYTLGASPCSERDDASQVTDSNGFVVFPERIIRLSLLSRIGLPVFNVLNLLAHGSIGSDVYLLSSGPNGDERLVYNADKPLPNKFILPSKKAETGKE